MKQGSRVARDSLARHVGGTFAPLVHGVDGVEILVAPDHLAPTAVAALGWDGVVLPPMVLLGRRVVVVAELLQSAHDQRRATGWEPVDDRVTVSTWDWPEMAHLAPPPAVRLVGIIAPARHWRTGLAAAVPFGRLCPTALLLPADVARDVDCLRQADRFGVGVVAAAGLSDVDPMAVDVLRTGRVGAGRAVAAGRWVHEVAYEALLARSRP